MDVRTGIKRVGVVLFATVAFGGSRGSAQAAPGDHITVGKAELVPALQTGLEYRSNVYLEEGTESNPTDAGMNFWVRPLFDLSLDSDDLFLALSAEYTARKYFAARLSNLDRFADFGVSLDLDALPKAVLGFKIEEVLRSRARAAETRSAVDEGEPIPVDANIKHLSNTLVGQLSVHPGGPLTVDVGGHFNIDNYSVPEGVLRTDTPSLNDRIGYGPNLDLRWAFFPRTAIVGSFQMDWFDWKDNFLSTGGANSTEAEQLGAYVGVPDGMLWEFSGGLRGRITEKTVIGALVGYGQIGYNEDSVLEDAADEADVPSSEVDAAAEGFDADLKGLNGLLVTLEAGYTPAENHTISAGFRKDFRDVYFTNFVDFVYFYGRYRGRFIDQLKTSAEFGYRLEDYQGEVARKDHFLRTQLEVGYEATRWFEVGTGVEWVRRASADREHPEIEYDDFRVHLDLNFTY